MPFATRLFAVFLVTALVVTAPAADLPPNEKLNTRIADVTLADATGKPISLVDTKDKKAAVIVFVSFECPVSNSYAPVLAELAKAYQPKGVRFLAVNSSDDLDAAQVARAA